MAHEKAAQSHRRAGPENPPRNGAFSSRPSRDEPTPGLEHQPIHNRQDRVAKPTRRGLRGFVAGRIVEGSRRLSLSVPKDVARGPRSFRERVVVIGHRGPDPGSDGNFNFARIMDSLGTRHSELRGLTKHRNQNYWATVCGPVNPPFQWSD